jgi:hypothetical protein
MSDSEGKIEEQSVEVESGNQEVKEPVADVKPKKKKLKKILIYSALICAGILLILSFSMGFIIKGAVNHFLPTLTGTDVNMESCFLNPFTGSLSIKNFTVGNPEGYKSKYAFKLDEVFVDLDMGSLSSDKIIIQTILVDGMEVSFETKMTETNIGAIKDNIDKVTKGDETAESSEETEKGDETQSAPESKSGSDKSIQIDDFRFINSKVVIAAQVMDTGSAGAIPIPDIEMKDIGSDSGGASVSEVSAEVINELYIAIVKAANNVTSDALKEGAGKGIEKIKEGTGAMIKGVKNLFGGDEK